MQRKHECKYFLMDDKGVRRCSVCGKPAKPVIEDKNVEAHEDKAVKNG